MGRATAPVENPLAGLGSIGRAPQVGNSSRQNARHARGSRPGWAQMMTERGCLETVRPAWRMPIRDSRIVGQKSSLSFDLR